MIHDRARLGHVLGSENMEWLRRRLRRALELGRELPRSVVLRPATPAQRDEVERLFGRAARLDAEGVSVDVKQLATILRDARICDDLVEALVALDGSIRDRAAEARAREAAWSALDEKMALELRGLRWADAWYRELRASGLLAKLAEGEIDDARALLETALPLIRRWPEPGLSLPEVAAVLVGDAHALDRGRPLGTLLVRAAAAFGELDDWQSPDGRRDCWAAVGILCDELSAPVLTLGLSASGDGLTDRVLRVHAEAGEACSLNLRQLVRHPPKLDHLDGRDVFVCENPAIVAAAVDRLGARCAPLVCTAGYLRGATRLLLRALATSGARLRVRADFDVDGLHIATKTLALPRATPWRFDAATYAGGAAGPKLTRAAVPSTPWDPELREAMQERKRGVHEEAVLPLLLADLSRPESV